MEKDVPYIVHESISSRLERTIKRLWVICLLLIMMLVGSNAMWLYYESQFEHVDSTTIDQSADGTNITQTGVEE